MFMTKTCIYSKSHNASNAIDYHKQYFDMSLKKICFKNTFIMHILYRNEAFLNRHLLFCLQRNLSPRQICFRWDWGVLEGGDRGFYPSHRLVCYLRPGVTLLTRPVLHPQVSTCHVKHNKHSKWTLKPLFRLAGSWHVSRTPQCHKVEFRKRSCKRSALIIMGVFNCCCSLEVDFMQK